MAIYRMSSRGSDNGKKRGERAGQKDKVELIPFIEIEEEEEEFYGERMRPHISIEQLSKQRFSLSFRLLFFLLHLFFLFLAVLALIATVVTTLLLILSFGRVESIVKKQALTWRLFKRVLVFSLATLVGLIHPPFGIGIALVYFIVEPTEIKEGGVARFLRKRGFMR